MPAEFLEGTDFDAVLRGMPIREASLRALLYIGADGRVRKIQWQGFDPANQIMLRLSDFIAQQRLRPATRKGLPVASTLGLELELGVQAARTDDLPTLQQQR